MRGRLPVTPITAYASNNLSHVHLRALALERTSKPSTFAEQKCCEFQDGRVSWLQSLSENCDLQELIGANAKKLKDDSVHKWYFQKTVVHSHPPTESPLQREQRKLVPPVYISSRSSGTGSYTVSENSCEIFDSSDSIFIREEEPYIRLDRGLDRRNSNNNVRPSVDEQSSCEERSDAFSSFSSKEQSSRDDLVDTYQIVRLGSKIRDIQFTNDEVTNDVHSTASQRMVDVDEVTTDVHSTASQRMVDVDEVTTDVYFTPSQRMVDVEEVRTNSYENEVQVVDESLVEEESKTEVSKQWSVEVGEKTRSRGSRKEGLRWHVIKKKHYHKDHTHRYRVQNL